jgi:hypothetical protein
MLIAKHGLLRFRMLSICCYYSPERYRGMPMRQWLDEVIAELEQSLNA